MWYAVSNDSSRSFSTPQTLLNFWLRAHKWIQTDGKLVWIARPQLPSEYSKQIHQRGYYYDRVHMPDFLYVIFAHNMIRSIFWRLVSAARESTIMGCMRVDELKITSPQLRPNVFLNTHRRKQRNDETNNKGRSFGNWLSAVSNLCTAFSPIHDHGRY